MSFSLNNAFWIIKNFAEEVGYSIEEIGENSMQVHLDKFHAVDFEVKANSSGYIQCKEWDENREEYNRAIYSIRSVSDVVRFCIILENSEIIRAKRLEE
jgi:hypothetical protein